MDKVQIGKDRLRDVADVLFLMSMSNRYASMTLSEASRLIQKPVQQGCVKVIAEGGVPAAAVFLARQDLGRDEIGEVGRASLEAMVNWGGGKALSLVEVIGLNRDIEKRVSVETQTFIANENSAN